MHGAGLPSPGIGQRCASSSSCAATGRRWPERAAIELRELSAMEETPREHGLCRTQDALREATCAGRQRKARKNAPALPVKEARLVPR